MFILNAKKNAKKKKKISHLRENPWINNKVMKISLKVCKRKICVKQ